MAAQGVLDSGHLVRRQGLVEIGFQLVLARWLGHDGLKSIFKTGNRR
jgi:hypothetical protein